MKIRSLLFSFFMIGFLNAQETEFTMDPGNFSALEVYNGINLNMIKGDKNELKVSLKDITRDRFVVNNENGLLSFRVKDVRFDDYQINVILTYKNIPQSISAYSESDIMQESVFQTDSIIMHARMNANLTFYLNVRKANIMVQEGSMVTLNGFVDTLIAESHTNATVEAFGLEAENAKLEASTKGRIKVTVNQDLDAYANINGFIGYKGNPAKVTQKKKLGGSIHKL